jgi:hypothetical protein
LLRMAESAFRPISNTGIDAVDIDMVGSSLHWSGGAVSTSRILALSLIG